LYITLEVDQAISAKEVERLRRHADRKTTDRLRHDTDRMTKDRVSWIIGLIGKKADVVVQVEATPMYALRKSEDSPDRLVSQPTARLVVGCVIVVVVARNHCYAPP
jgi:hypothetical protein